MADIGIRPATNEDLPAVRALLVETWHATYDHLFGRDRVTAITDEWHSLANLARGIERPCHRFLVAEAATGALVGTASATLKDRGQLSLDRLYVHPARQRQVVGRQLLAAALAGWDGLRRIQLEVEPRNAAAIAFYRRFGFLPVAAPGPEGGLEHLVMRRAVPPAGFGIRQAEASDAASIRDVVVAAHRGERTRSSYSQEVVDWLVAETTEQGIAAQIVQWDVWVATEPDGSPCGTAAFDGERVRKVFVHPDRQGLGLGHVLLDAVEQGAWAAGLPRLAVRSSLPAIEFYASRGFVRGDDAAHGPAAMVMMHKTLLRAGYA
jgi:GNAT superfamily N-acetyltransferase